MRKHLACVVLGLLTCGFPHPLAAARTIEFTTTQVTKPDVTLSPDGQWLIFTMLGHVFRLPVAGGRRDDDGRVKMKAVPRPSVRQRTARADVATATRAELVATRAHAAPAASAAPTVSRTDSSSATAAPRRARAA